MNGQLKTANDERLALQVRVAGGSDIGSHIPTPIPTHPTPHTHTLRPAEKVWHPGSVAGGGGAHGSCLT